MIEGEHSFTKTGRQRQVSHIRIAEWMFQAWMNKDSTIKNEFRNSGLYESNLK